MKWFRDLNSENIQKHEQNVAKFADRPGRWVKSLLYVVKSSLIFLFSGSHQFHLFFFSSKFLSRPDLLRRLVNYDELFIQLEWYIMMENKKSIWLSQSKNTYCTFHHIFTQDLTNTLYSGCIKYDQIMVQWITPRW